MANVYKAGPEPGPGPAPAALLVVRPVELVPWSSADPGRGASAVITQYSSHIPHIYAHHIFLTAPVTHFIYPELCQPSLTDLPLLPRPVPGKYLHIRPWLIAHVGAGRLELRDCSRAPEHPANCCETRHHCCLK